MCEDYKAYRAKIDKEKEEKWKLNDWKARVAENKESRIKDCQHAKWKFYGRLYK